MRDDTHGLAVARTTASPDSDEHRAQRRRLSVCHIVDEDAQIRHFLSLILHGKGVRTEEYSDGQSFLQAVDQHPADLLFVDVPLDSAETIHLVETLGKKGYFGFLQLMSNRGSAVLEHIRKIAEQQGLITLPVLPKPFGSEAIVGILSSLQLGDAAPPVTARFGLDEALANNWIEYWYQPKIDLRRKQLIGAEAFVRGRHPKHGVVPPAAFMPGAADGDLLALAEHSLTNALKAGAKFSELGISLRLAINMSMNSVVQLPIADIVRSHDSNAGYRPGLIIDVAEADIVRDLDAATKIATKLAALNVRLAIDDYGRGYSALAQLKELPFAELKLSRTFVADCGSDRSRARMCRTLIELAHNFESKAVAVGIEKASEATALVSMGCDYGQGFLLGQPMTEERFTSLLRLRAAPTTASPPQPLKAPG